MKLLYNFGNIFNFIQTLNFRPSISSRRNQKKTYYLALFGSLAYATTTIDGSTADLTAPKAEQEVDIKSYKLIRYSSNH